jgi:hypothetical protein
MPKANPIELLDHLGYEWWMFRETRELFRCAGQEDNATRNALAEVLTIHGRALVQFFYREKRFEDTDWNVTDLGIDLPRPDQEPPELTKWYDATGQYVAHLTQHRAKLLQELKTRTVSELLGRCVEKVRAAMGRDMPKGWIGDRPTTLRCPDFGDEPGPFGETGARGQIFGPEAGQRCSPIVASPGF